MAHTKKMLGVWTALGVGVGAAISVALKNIAIGVGVGAALGVVIGILSSKKMA
jgi:hypothetical protein